ncbi:MAG: CHAT domain-containing protein [Burkholderiales bacterium]|nr:CHAT domain-containing protein [Burkholderiales bacterium]
MLIQSTKDAILLHNNKKMLKRLVIFFLILSSLVTLSNCAQLPQEKKYVGVISAREIENNEFNKNIKRELMRYEDKERLENALSQIPREKNLSLKLRKIEPWLQRNGVGALSPEKQPHIWILLNMWSAYANKELSYSTKTIGGYENALGNYENALDALQIISHYEYPLKKAAIQNNLAKILVDLSSQSRVDYVEKAISYAQQALRVRTRSQFPEDWARTHIILAKALHDRSLGDKTSNLRHSADSFEQALEIQTFERSPDEYLMAVYELSQVLLELGQYQKSLTYLEKALELIEIQLQQNTFYDEKERFLINQAESLFFSAIWAAVQMKNYAKALQLMEWGKGRILRKKIQLNDLDKNTQPSILTILHWLSDLPSDSTIVAPIFSNQGTIVFILPVGIKNIGAENIVIIDGFTRKDLHALIRGEKDNEWGGYILAYAELKAKILNLKNDNQERNAWREKIEKTLKDFSQWIDPTFKQLQEMGIRRNSRLILLTDSDSGFLPIHSVQFQGQPLLAHYSIHFAPSIYGVYLAHKNLKKIKNKNILAVINPDNDLEWTEIEDKFINFAPKKRLMRVEANLENFWQAMKNLSPGYLHFASHGVFDFREPMKSGLKLSDGLLTVEELLSKPVNYLEGNRLVVLSACETTLVDIHAPSESIGIPLSFLQAGAPGVISSLWLVNDISTAVLMAKFYQLHIDESLEPARALVKAQQWLRSASVREINKLLRAKNVTLDPARYKENTIPYQDWYYWAGFVYIGM